jgi:CDP-glycerol glycerophosphotransferase
VSYPKYIHTRLRPLISIVIPVFDVEKYLIECLDSITQQTYGNIEIIAVDGASTDASGSILEDRMGKEPRLKVLHEGNIGPGAARNIGVKCATGDYIWFVDGDDIVSSGCLSAIANHVEATSPDVLLVDYEALYSNGKCGPGFGHELMARQAAKCFTLAEQPWAIDFSMASWNKVVRRNFFHSASVSFSSDWPHEDVPVSCLLLLEASRLSILNHVCYRHRQDRFGSAMLSGPARRHFNIFDAYETVFREVERRISDNGLVMTQGICQTLFERAIWHYTTIFDTVGLGVSPLGSNRLIARQDRREYFTRMHRDYLRYVPAGYRHPSGARGLKFRFIAGNDYWTYSILDPVNKLRNALRRSIRAKHHRLTEAGR